MLIIKGLEIKGLSLNDKENELLIIGDLHIGQEEALTKEGMLIPRNQYKDILVQINHLVKENKPKTIIINGDLKHNFGKISEHEWKKITEILKNLSEKSKLIIIKGNHDAVLKPITDKLKIPLLPHYYYNKIFICHGEEIPKTKEFINAETIIIGHEHPAIRLREGARTETYKAFLKGKYKNKNLIVMPSFNPLTEGSDILTEKILSPFLKKAKLKEFEAFIIGDKPYNFGKLSELEDI